MHCVATDKNVDVLIDAYVELDLGGRELFLRVLVTKLAETERDILIHILNDSNYVKLEELEDGQEYFGSDDPKLIISDESEHRKTDDSVKLERATTYFPDALCDESPRETKISSIAHDIESDCKDTSEEFKHDQDKINEFIFGLRVLAKF